MSSVSSLLAHHPWWAAAALGVPVATVAWGVIAPHLLEARHAAHMLGRPPSTGGDD